MSHVNCFPMTGVRRCLAVTGGQLAWHCCLAVTKRVVPDGRCYPKGVWWTKAVHCQRAAARCRTALQPHSKGVSKYQKCLDGRRHVCLCVHLDLLCHA